MSDRESPCETDPPDAPALRDCASERTLAALVSVFDTPHPVLALRVPRLSGFVVRRSDGGV